MARKFCALWIGVVVVLSSLAPSSAYTATLAGVFLPDREQIAGTELILNGAAVRTATLLRIPVYVAGLYLEQPDHDAQQILTSSQPKLLRFVFLRSVGAEKVRSTWRHAIEKNCVAPCQLAPAEIEQFISHMPSMRKGDIADVAVTQQGVSFIVNGQNLGQVTDPKFVQVILLSYIGPKASSPAVRNGMLGQQ